MKPANESVTSTDATPQLELASWQKLIFPILLWSIHQFLNFATNLAIQFQYVWRVFLEAYSSDVTFDKIAKKSQNNLTKIPQHVAFAFLEPKPELSTERISHLVRIVL